MFKKVVIGMLLTGLLGFLVVGAVNRTMDKVAQGSEEGQSGRKHSSQSQGQGQEANEGRGGGQGSGY